MGSTLIVCSLLSELRRRDWSPTPSVSVHLPVLPALIGTQSLFPSQTLTINTLMQNLINTRLFQMSFKDFLQNVHMYGTYVKTATICKWISIACLVIFYFVYIIVKLISIWITLV